MAGKKVLKIPKDKFYTYEGTYGPELPYEEEGGFVILKVADIIENLEMAERQIASYHGNRYSSKNGFDLYHFTKYNCIFNEKNFKSHECLCVYLGEERWHKPGKCSIPKN